MVFPAPWRDFFAGLAIAVLIAGTAGHDFEASLRHGLFQATSILTTTGYASEDFALWQEGAMMVLFMLMFMVASWLANSWANSSTSRTMQYAGLGLYVVAEAIIFAPLLTVAMSVDPDIPLAAGVTTLAMFGALTAAAAAAEEKIDGGVMMDVK